MTPSSGEITLNDIHSELTTSPTSSVSLGENDVSLMIDRNFVLTTPCSFSDWYNTTAKPGVNWGGSTYSILDTTPSSGGTYAQAVVYVDTNGRFRLVKYDSGNNTTTTYYWSPLGSSATETSGDYQIHWNLISGVTPGTSTGFTEDTWHDFTGTEFLVITDTSDDGLVRTCTVDISIRTDNTYALSVTQRFNISANFNL